MHYLRKSQVKEPNQTAERSRLAARLLPTRTHRAQGEGGRGRGRGTDTPLAKSVTNTICIATKLLKNSAGRASSRNSKTNLKQILVRKNSFSKFQSYSDKENET